MGHKAVSSTTFSCLLAFFFLFLPCRIIAQEKAPVFWTRGGNWGTWLKITAHRGLAIRTACGDDSTLNKYPVSSTDWQLRNNYTEPMAVVWRVQFFNDTSGKNEMSGWMLEHLGAGEVSDGWSVEGGHCQARNVISVQVKCAVPDGDEAKCYDADGNPYPPRPDGAFSGDHNPASGSQASTPDVPGPDPNAPLNKMICLAGSDINKIMMTQVFSSRVGFYDAGEKFQAWVVKNYPEFLPGKTQGQCQGGFPDMDKFRSDSVAANEAHHWTVISVTWTP